MSGATEDKQRAMLFSLDITQDGQVLAPLVQAKADEASWQAKK